MFACSEGSLSSPVACAADHSKAVIWVWFLLHKNVSFMLSVSAVVRLIYFTVLIYWWWVIILSKHVLFFNTIYSV